MSPRNTKLFKGPLAADSTGDIPQHVRDFLTGSTAIHLASQLQGGNATSPTIDSQQSIQQFLLGTTAFRAPGITAPNERPLAGGDTQAAERRILLAQHLASDAS